MAVNLTDAHGAPFLLMQPTAMAASWYPAGVVLSQSIV